MGRKEYDEVGHMHRQNFLRKYYFRNLEWGAETIRLQKRPSNKICIFVRQFLLNILRFLSSERFH